MEIIDGKKLRKQKKLIAIERVDVLTLERDGDKFFLHIA